MKKLTVTKKTLAIVGVVILSIAMIVSVGINIYLGFFSSDGFYSYLQSTDQIYIMESGILKNFLEFADGQDLEILYNFDNEEYPLLIETYGIDKIAGSGSEFERALRLMNEYAPRLTHKSNYDNSIEMNAVSLLKYSLDNEEQGINCRNKAQILNEMCLALGIYSRKVWLMPNSEYDGDCHVVNEVWDTQLNKWVMLDITNNMYWADENGKPLSVLEIRYKGAMQEFCTPVHPEDKLDDLESLKEKYIGNFLYIMKNLVHTEYCDINTVGESNTIYLLFPENLDTDYDMIISQTACEQSPIK